MLFSRPVPPQVLKTIEEGGLVLCANARAARALNALYGEHLLATTETGAWETPQVLDWQQWLHAQWRLLLLTGSEDRVLLSPLQEETIWNEIAGPAVEKRSLIAPEEIARLSMSGFALLSDYGADDFFRSDRWNHVSTEQNLFRGWALEMERRCERNHWLRGARLSWVIARALEDGRLRAPSNVLWNGFDRLLPAVKHVRDVLSSLGGRQSELDWQQEAAERVMPAPGAMNELQACARWVKAHLDEDPSRRIAVLAPDVEAVRADIDRVFREVLSPDETGLRKQPGPQLYEFTLGQPLGDVPVVAAAVALLRWCAGPMQQEVMTTLLTTGFFGDVADHPALAEADLRLRRKLSVPELAMNDALDRLQKVSANHWAVATWVRCMRRAQAVVEPVAGKARSWQHWVATADKALSEAGWPGERAADTIGYQVRKRWQQALEEISALSFHAAPCSYARFLDGLASHLRRSIFSPESQGAAVIISGLPESAGQSFDAVWVLGMTDTAWPVRTRKHALLPSLLQTECGMPGSRAEVDLQFGDAVLHRLRDCTRELVFSYPVEGAEGAQRPSALLAGVAKNASLLVAAEQTASPSLLETYNDEMTVPWPGGRAAGGQSVLKMQSACPFQAFASRRLGTREMPSLEPGLSAMDRGNVVHAVLETLWTELVDSRRLLDAMVQGTLASIVQRHVTAALEEHVEMVASDWEREYLRLQSVRLCGLVEDWLEYESRRKPFVVEAQEKKVSIEVVEGLSLDVRLDRVDLAEGGRVLIDYKTGLVNAGMWQGERPQEPQLPVYALFGNVERLHDVAFAQVRSDGPKFIDAAGNDDDFFPHGQGPDAVAGRLRDFMSQWEIAIQSLSLEYKQGVATVTPRRKPNACQYCKFPSLCRVAELGGTEDESAEEELP